MRDLCRKVKDSMKKILALVFSLMMVTSAAYAAAEQPQGLWVQFESGFELCLPSDWQGVEVTEEEAAAGVVYTAASADQTQIMQVAWAALPAAMSIDDMHAALSQTFPAIERMESDGFDMLLTFDVANDTLVFMMMDPVKQGYYGFFFLPGADDELLNKASLVMSSLRAVR